METKSEGNSKVLDSVRRLFLDLSDQHESKSRVGNKQTVSSLNELTDTVCSSSTRSSTKDPLLLSKCIEVLVYAYSSIDQDIRLCASENLRKLIKALMGTHLFKIQQSLFHELKKNGTARSVCIALECFSSLVPRTRPQKCHNMSHQFHPVLLRIMDRPEEIIHEKLVEALPNILPIMTPFLSSNQVQSLMVQLYLSLPKSLASCRRMVSCAISLLCLHCQAPVPRTEWIITKLIGQATAHTASQHVIQGVLLTFYQLLLNFDKLRPSLSIVKQMYSLCISAMLYGEQNTINSALEVIEQLLLSASTEFSLFLTSTALNPSLAPNFWMTAGSAECLSLDEKSETGSQLEAPCEEYFEFEESVDPSNQPTEVGNDAKNLSLTPQKRPSLTSSFHSGKGSPTSSVDSWTLSTVSLTDESCFTSITGNVPLQDLIEYMKGSILTHKRVSIKSVGLSVVSASLNIDRNCIADFSDFEDFLIAEDPKLVSRMTNLLSCFIAAELRACDRNVSKCRPLIAVACEKLYSILSSEVAVILKAACESLQLCLPLLLSSNHPNEGVNLLKKLMNLIDINYWLLKVELLQTLAVVDYAQLAVVEPSLLPLILEEVVFPLISDSDHRVRAAVCNTLTKLAKTLDQTDKPLPVLALQHVKKFFDHLHAKPIQLSLAGIGRTDSQVVPSIPSCLETIVWHCMVVLGSSQDQVGQKGALEVLCALSEEYPPPTLPNLWGVKCSECGLLEMVLQMSRGSWLSRQVQTHTQLLQISTSLFLACALDSLHQAASEGHEWDRGIERVGVVRHSTTLLLHLMKLLNIFQHILEGRDPEDKETKNVLLKKMETLSPKSKSSGGEHPSVSLKEMIGSVAGSPNYLRLYESLSAAYTNYQVSINPSSDDKFSVFLTQLHNCLAAVLEVSLADEVGRHVEELLGYLTVTMKVDAPGALLCIQQLLNALFGMNVATQQTHVYSPFLCSLPYTLKAPPTTTPSDSLVECLINNPVQMMYQSLRTPVSSPNSSPYHQSYPENKYNKLWLFGTRSNTVLKPTNSLSSIKDYIAHFESSVVNSIYLFSTTPSILIQERVLYMIVQLLHLKVRYELLDCNGTFFDSVNKQVALMESGNVGGGAQIVPHLFQFLVMLANDTKVVSIPEVIQKCDSVMASGKNVSTFAVPAMRPLVLYLFVRSTGKISKELNTQREVTLNMLLRLVDDPNVINLLINILECYQSNAQEWLSTSSLVYAFLLAPIGRLQMALDSMSAISSLYHLFAAMTPSSISIQALVVAHLKQTSLSSPLYLTRWLAVLTCILRLIYTIPEDKFFKEIKGMKLAAPTVMCNGVEIQPPRSVKSEESVVIALSFAGFIMDSLAVAVRCVQLILRHHQQGDVEMLATVVSDLLILMKTLIERDFPFLKSSLASLSLPDYLLESLVGVSHSFPLIPLHFFSLLVSSWFSSLNDVMKQFLSCFSVPVSPNEQLLLQSLVVTVPEPEKWAESLDPLLLYDHFGGEEMVEFTKRACQNEEFSAKLKSLILSLDLSSITDCIKAISLIRCLASEGGGGEGGMEIMRLVAKKLVNHPIRGINEEAESLLLEMLPSCQSSPNQVEELVTTLQPIRNKIPKLWATLQTMLGSSSPVTVAKFDPLNDTSYESLLMEINKEWQIRLINSICSSPAHSPSLTPTRHSSFSTLLCIDLLPVLQEQDIVNVMNHTQFPSYMIEECIVQAIFHLLAKRSSIKSSMDYAMPTIATPLQYEALLSTSVEKVFQFIEKYVTDSKNNGYQMAAPYMARSLVWLLLSWSQVITKIPLNEKMAENCLSFAEKFLGDISESLPLCNSVAMETALDLCSLTLQTEETFSCIEYEWACSVISRLTKIVEQEFSATFTTQTEESKDVDLATKQLRWIFSQLLALPPLDFSPSIHLLAVSLARLAIFTYSVTIPPLLLSMGSGTVTETLLDKSLVDVDILMEYMQRINTMGWSAKNQFEERWMQLLGVLNMAPPSEEMPVEEQLAHNMSLSMGVRSATSVLLGTSLRPIAGNPVWSVPLHTHRNKDFNFLSSPAGKKLLPHRSLIESRLILDCAVRSHCHSHYQIPFKHEVQAQTYPPVFSQNLERPIGSLALTPCQLSYTSLLPIILKIGFNRSGSPTSVDGVDLRSCVISLIELFTHWFTQPMDLLHLHHTLASIVMLSDLFFLSNQFEWMLQTFLNLSQSHPQEDLLSEPLVVFGVLKAAAILRVDGVEAEKVAKIVELATGSDTFVNTQNACLEGMLFIVENAESAVLSLVGPSIARYILTHLEQYQNYSERHLLLVWSLGTHLALLQAHSQPTKDPSYTTHLLELAPPILCDQHTSSRVVRAILLGLEHMVLSFSLSSKDKSAVMRLAADRFMKSDHSKSLSALALLLTCMYTGEEADRVSGLAMPQDNMEDLKESVYQSRENISNLLERLRQGNQMEVEFLVKLLPGVIVDFLPPMDAMNTVVTEVISQQQTRPWMAAMIMFKTFELLIQTEMDPTKPSGSAPTVMDWVLLSLDSFIQQEPERHAIWCITCLLMAGSINPTLRAVYPVVVHKMYPDEDWLDRMLCTAANLFYNQNNFPQDQKKGFAEKFQKSPYTILHRLVHCLK